MLVTGDYLIAAFLKPLHAAFIVPYPTINEVRVFTIYRENVSGSTYGGR
jgi:hypothetical protein